MQHKIVITRHRPWFRAALLAGATSLLLIVAWGIYAYTRATTVSDFARAQTELERLQAERRQLTRDLRAARNKVEELRNQLAYEKRSVEINAHTCDEVRQSLVSLQTEASNLREQLAFYRGIAAPAQAKAGVRVQDLRIYPNRAGHYEYDLTLIQAARENRSLNGTARMELQGVRNGVRQSLPLEAIGVGELRKLVFSMKYYQEFRGEFRLPRGFRPQRAVVTLQLDGDDAPRVEESFEWGRILVAGGESDNVRQ